MLGSPKTVYWDACVFASYINRDPGRIEVLEPLLDQSAGSGSELKIYAASLSHVEVAYAASEKESKTLDQDQERRINDLWTGYDAVISVESNPAINDIARDLMRRSIPRGWSLKPADAIQLATAQWLSETGIPISEFHTYDRSLRKYAEFVSFEIVEPYTEQPMMTFGD